MTRIRHDDIPRIAMPANGRWPYCTTQWAQVRLLVLAWAWRSSSSVMAAVPVGSGRVVPRPGSRPVADRGVCQNALPTLTTTARLIDDDETRANGEQDFLQRRRQDPWYPTQPTAGCLVDGLNTDTLRELHDERRMADFQASADRARRTWTR